MGRNIVLCSDGTGNKGGSGSDTNVFKLYQAIESVKERANQREQIIFYDNGVGTAAHAVYRAYGAATGRGFKQNVRDLYEFTGRHYKDGDDIYGFGFSRGAATIRAFAGMVKHCGLVRKNTGKINGHGKEEILDETEFQRQVDAAMATYVFKRGSLFSLGRLWQAIFPPGNYVRHDVEIELLGLWDTVAALGFPQIPLLDAIVNFFRRHKFYDFEPAESVKHVFHAVAVDDERRTFWALIWNENLNKDQHIEQVWFPGVHSNIGGGYPRAGLANITLDWMITRLDAHSAQVGNDRGLVLKQAFRDEVYDGVNPYGKMYDSRAGLALLYRYQPRPITELCAGRLRDNEAIRIHASVLGRMNLRTAGYVPGQLPQRFDVVKTREPEAIKVHLNDPIWQTIRDKINIATARRITLYWTFLTTSIVLLAVSFLFWTGELGEAWHEECCKPDVVNAALESNSVGNRLLGHITDILHYFLPDAFQNIITFGFLIQPWWGGAFALVVVIYYVLRSRFKRASDEACERARVFVLQHQAEEVER